MKFIANWVVKHFSSLKPLLDAAQISGKQRLELSIFTDRVDLAKVAPGDGQTVLVAAGGCGPSVPPVDFNFAHNKDIAEALSAPLEEGRVVGALRLMPHGSRGLTIFCNSASLRSGTAELRNQLAPFNLACLR